MLYYVQLPQPCLIEGVTRSVYNMAEPVLLRQDEHGVK